MNNKKPAPAELDYLHTEPKFTAEQKNETGNLSASGIFLDKNEKEVGCFSVLISGDRHSGFDPRHYIEVVIRTLESFEERLK